jgi:hypothetical protein
VAASPAGWFAPRRLSCLRVEQSPVSVCVPFIAHHMNDRAAISAIEKIQIGFVRLVLRRLMDCGTPKAAKEYDLTLRVHLCELYVAIDRRMRRPTTTSASEKADSK